MKIGPIDTTEQVLVVAEIGNNHEGNLDVARRRRFVATACTAKRRALEQCLGILERIQIQVQIQLVGAPRGVVGVTNRAGPLQGV